ncbi:MAG: DUF1376 domain-containing protein [Rhodopseudomonas sp.]|nr:DUF1376 domain-containing protein [Rhodopseudomonas sp.]
MDEPAPFTPPDLDLRDFPYMPLDVVRLRDSEIAILSTGDAFRAAVLLWCTAWHQVPAASLPTDDRLLSNLAGFGRDIEAWRAVKSGALHAFTLCSDGRLYHPVIAEKALEADGKRKSQRKRTAAATEARRRAQEPSTPERDVDRNVDRNGDRDDYGTDKRNVVQGKGREGKGEEAKGREHDLSKKDISAVAVATAGAIWGALFQKFWESYPKRQGANPKEPARIKFLAAIKSGEDPDVIIESAKSYARELARENKVGTPFVARALTWLTEKRWKDYQPSPEDSARLAKLDADMAAKGYAFVDGKGWVKKVEAGAA